MLKTPATLALMLCDFANSWGLYVLVTEGPIFFSEALCFDIQKVTSLASNSPQRILRLVSFTVMTSHAMSSHPPGRDPLQPPVPGTVCWSSSVRPHLQLPQKERPPVCPLSPETERGDILPRPCGR